MRLLLQHVIMLPLLLFGKLCHLTNACHNVQIIKQEPRGLDLNKDVLWVADREKIKVSPIDKKCEEDGSGTTSVMSTSTLTPTATSTPTTTLTTTPFDPTKGKLLFVLGGYGDGDGVIESAVEIIDLSNENLTCPRPRDFPVGYGSVGTFINNTVMGCGGEGGQIGSNISSKCYNYDPSTDSWTETYSMLEGRVYAQGVQLSQTKFWVVGGNDVTTTSDIFTVGEGFKPYVDLMFPGFYHSMVKINDTCVSRIGAFAGIATYLDGRQELVLGPDFRENPLEIQIWNLTSMTWRHGPIFPEGSRYGGASVPYRDTFLLVGGTLQGSYVRKETIYKYEVANGGGWSLLPQKLVVPRQALVAFMVPDDYVTCVPKADGT